MVSLLSLKAFFCLKEHNFLGQFKTLFKWFYKKGRAVENWKPPHRKYLNPSKGGGGGYILIR